MTNGHKNPTIAYLNTLDEEWHSHEFTTSYLPPLPPPPAQKASPFVRAAIAAADEDQCGPCGGYAVFLVAVAADE